MTRTINRMQLLSGDLDGTKQPIRPPWSIEEVRFVATCDSCGDCLDACDDQLIRLGRGKLPMMDFSQGGCDFCGDCATACKPGALLQEADGKRRPPWNLTASLLSGCLALNSVICRSCGEACEARAITFSLRVGGAAEPALDGERCTGCGACLAVCPTHAIALCTGDPPNSEVKVA